MAEGLPVASVRVIYQPQQGNPVATPRSWRNAPMEDFVSIALADHSQDVASIEPDHCDGAVSRRPLRVCR
jgi:hypothetical protein